MRVGWLCVAVVVLGCRSERTPIRKESLPVRTIDAAPSIAPPNEPLACFKWLDPSVDARPPFPHPITPGDAIARVLDWATEHHAAKRPSVALENVRCPKERCIEPDDCWFRIRLDDAEGKAPPQFVSWLEVHARTGNVRWNVP